MSITGKQNRYYELDVFRGIAIIAVLLFHYTTRYNQLYGHLSTVPFSFPIGHYGVELFFIVSGFVIFMSLEKINNDFDFIVNRVSKLYPAYWISILITFTTVSIFTLPGRECSLTDALINLSMLQGWLNTPHVDGAYWTLSSFLSFYFIMFCIYKLKLLKHIELICMIWILIMFTERYLTLLGYRIPARIQLTLLLNHGHLFIIGIFFYLIKCQGHSAKRNVMIFICLLSQLLIGRTSDFLAIALLIVLFYFFIFDYLRFICIKPLIFLGQISYSLYLIHQNIGYVVIRSLYEYDFSYLSIIIIPTLISLILATLITFVVEEPTLKYLRNVSWRRQLRSG